MSRINTRIVSARPMTHEGAPAKNINAAAELRRTLMACLLWEDQFYENGTDIADRIAALVPKVTPEIVAEMAIEARENMKLRHAPLLVVREMARLKNCGPLVAQTLARVIQRPDELAEFMAIYWKNKKEPVSAGVKRGLAAAFPKFNAYQLAKYNRDQAIKLRDVLFICHAKPRTKAQAKTWSQLIDGTLPIPDTWEVRLTEAVWKAVAHHKKFKVLGMDKARKFIEKMDEVTRKRYYAEIDHLIVAEKKKVWLKLMKSESLGALALIRNLRNMQEVGVDKKEIGAALKAIDTERVLPFRFITAARHNPAFEAELEEALMKCLKGQKKLKGKTVLLIDVSGSMDTTLSTKSEVNRIDAAAGLGILVREICEDAEIFTFSNRLVRIPARHGFALRDAVQSSQEHSGTELGAAIKGINLKIDYDRIIVITDEQSADRVDNPLMKSKGYMINVASYKNGVGYGAWTHLDGWSDSLIEYIREIEGGKNGE